MVTRSGAWLIPRFLLGKPLEALDNRLTTYLPANFSQWTQTVLLSFLQGKLPPELQPSHKVLEAIPIIRSDFLEKANLGVVKAHRSGIAYFTETSLVLSNGTNLDVDTVIACTSYYVS